MPFEFQKYNIPGPILVKPRVFPDKRGYFLEVYKRTDFLANEIPYDFVQVNMSYSKKGVVRGLHYQLRPMEQGKLVMVPKGKIIDVAVDIRKGSPYFGRYIEAELSEQNKHLLWIPPGFAHGFQALENSIVVYFITKEYSPSYERCINWKDEKIGIEWPLVQQVLSDKDKECPDLDKAEMNFIY